MLKIQRFINELMSSNCYVVYDEEYEDCIVIDPGSEKCLQEQSFFEAERVKPSFVLLTHEHTDHTWGINTLIDLFNPQVICSKICAKNLEKEFNAYFRFYYDDLDYTYNVKKVDAYTDDIQSFKWNNHTVTFIPTPGHSMGSVCILINNYLFTGDAWMQYKPYINKRNGSKELYIESLQILKNQFSNTETYIMPGHGDMFLPNK